MSGFLDNAEIGIPFPKCGQKTKKTVGWLKSHNQMVCRCGAEINIDQRQFRDGVGKAERGMDDLKRALKRFGK
jgi:hypothetical protein